MSTGHQQLFASLDEQGWRKAEAYSPDPRLWEQLRTVARTIGLAWSITLPDRWIANDGDLVDKVIRQGTLLLLTLRHQSTIRDDTPHYRMAQGEVIARLVEAGVQHEGISWLRIGQMVSLAQCRLITFDRLRHASETAIPVPSRARLAIDDSLMQRAVDRAVERATQPDGSVPFLTFAADLLQIVAETDWLAIALQDAAELVGEDDDLVCICGVHWSEHALCGCADGFERARRREVQRVA